MGDPWRWLKLGAGITAGGVVGAFVVAMPLVALLSFASGAWTDAVCVPPDVLDAGGIAVYDLGCNHGYDAASLLVVLLAALIGFGFAGWRTFRKLASPEYLGWGPRPPA